MLYMWLTLGLVACAIQALRAARLLISALWLAGVSLFAASLLYLLGAHEVAVIELSVGAGLVTVLMVFAIGVSGDSPADRRSSLPRPLTWGLVLGAVLLLGWMVLPLTGVRAPAPQSGFKYVLWQQRSADLLGQIVLLFVGAIGVLGLLAGDHRPPLRLRSGLVTTDDEPAARSFILRPVAPPKGQPSSGIQMPDSEAAPEEVDV
jgi:NADH:ubiquinone oxidoreductase subunit 6 (subunit J)